MESEKVTGTQYAYVLTDVHLCRVNLSQLLSQDILPECEVIVDFRKEKLPIGMGGFVLKSKLYLTGGEKDPYHRGEVSAEYYSDEEVPEEDTSKLFNLDVYEVDPSNPSSPCTIQHNIMPLLSSKSGARTAVIDNKVYIFRDFCFLREYDVPFPPFECYHPDQNVWEYLPTPPGHKRDGLCYFNVLHRKIHIRDTNHPPRYYDVDSNEWCNAEDQGFLGQCKVNHIVDPFQANSLLSESPNGLVLTFSDKGLAAYLFDTDGRIKHHQILHEVNSLLPKDPHYYFGFPKDLGHGKFCFIYYAPGFYFYISIIQVLIQDHDDGHLSFLVNVLRGPHLICTHPSICIVRDVYIMSEDSKKRLADSVHAGQSFKKLCSIPQ